MSFTGMDIGQVRQLAAQFEQKAGEIDQIAAQLTSALGSASWVGPDRQKFEGDWNGQCRAQLRNVCETLREASRLANQNASQQEQASNT